MVNCDAQLDSLANQSAHDTKSAATGHQSGRIGRDLAIGLLFVDAGSGELVALQTDRDTIFDVEATN